MIWAAFILGLFGSLHCAGMCGPLALALPQTGSNGARFILGRMAYNLGRLVTYCLLGFLSGIAGRVLLLAGVQRWMSIGLGVVLLAGLLSSRRLAVVGPVVTVLNVVKSRMSCLLRRRSLLALGILGLLNGLLPCGLVYVGCANAAVAGTALGGMASMAVFGLGTIPMMLSISLSGRLVPTSLRLRLAKAVPLAVFGLATLLILRGMSLGIPYLSPELSAVGASCCHR
jgi:sulfite exporter TauE/SafE